MGNQLICYDADLPRRKMTPQHILVSISRQVIRLGEFLRLLHQVNSIVLIF